MTFNCWVDFERTVIAIAMTSTPRLHFVAIARCALDNIGDLRRGLGDGDCGRDDWEVEIVWIRVDGPVLWESYAGQVIPQSSQETAANGCI